MRGKKKRNVTLSDIADICGVAKATVSYALQGNRKRMSDEVFARIHKTAAEIGYDPAIQHAARRLSWMKQGKVSINHIISLFFPPRGLSLTYFTRIFQGIMTVLTAKRFGLLMNYDNSVMRSGHLLPIFARGEVDGAIVLAEREQFQPILESLRGLQGFGNRPLVSLMAPLPDASSVRTDDHRGACLVAKHLLDLGHRKILFFGRDFDTHFIYGSRRQGVLDAYREAGINPQENLIEMQWEQCKLIVSETIQQRPNVFSEVTAVMAPNDQGAVWILELLADRGLSVPQDISLTGYDDALPVLQGNLNNFLTTVRLPLEEVGCAAARMIIELVQMRGESEPQHNVLPVELVLRKSTAPPKNRA